MSLERRKLGHVVEPEDAFATTQMEKETFSFTWEIADFPELADVMYSPVFKGGPKSQHSWKLKIFPHYKSGKEGDEKYIGIFINFEKPGTGNGAVTKAEFQCSLLGVGRKILHNSFTVWTLSDSADWGWDQWILRSTILKKANGFLSDGRQLKIHCEIRTCGEFKHEPVSTRPETLENLEFKSCAVPMKMLDLLKEGKFSDVTLKTQSESFPCYKFILSAHSPVFEAMFGSGMTESTSNIVEIKDFSADALRRMIQFLFTGKTELLEENSGEILSLADKYQISGLKIKCEEILFKNLSIENAADTLILAHLHSPQILKPQVIYFVKRFRKEVVNTEGYKDMVKAYPIICSDLYASLE